MSDRPQPTICRGGEYYRVCKPEWADCGDTTFFKISGGRWNPAGEFGALYLNASVRVASAQVRQQHAGRAISLFDMRPERRPALAIFSVPRVDVVDAVNAAGIRALCLPKIYPVGVEWSPCQRIGRRAYHDGLAGVAARSNAEARVDETLGEELAYFDSQSPLSMSEQKPFGQWYPGPHPVA